MISLFITFHKCIFDELYASLTSEQKKMLVFYGVKCRQIPDDTELSVIYEYELPFYEPAIQSLRYNEASTFFHVYHNKHYNNNKFIGFFQYDMHLTNTQLDSIDNICKNATKPFVIAPFFATSNAKNSLGGSIQLLMHDIEGFGNPIENYNKYFNTNHTFDIVLKQPMIMCNTFIVSIELFEKFMSWMNQFFTNYIKSDELYDIVMKNPGLLVVEANTPKEDVINRGHFIEILTGMFFAFQIYEGCVLYHLNIDHLHNMRV